MSKTPSHAPRHVRPSAPLLPGRIGRLQLIALPIATGLLAGLLITMAAYSALAPAMPLI